MTKNKKEMRARRLEDATSYATHVAIGALSEGLGPNDVILNGFNGDDFGTRNPVLEAVVPAIYLDRGHRHGAAPTVTLIEPLLTKADRVAQLPQALADMTWSCRKPTFNRAGETVTCRACYACQSLARFLPERYGRGPVDAQITSPGLRQFVTELMGQRW